MHIVIDGIVDSTMADEPFSLYDALGGAQFTLEAVNKERGTNYLLPDVLLVSPRGGDGRAADRLSECEASAGEQQQNRPVADDPGKAAAGGLHHGLRGDLSCVCRRAGRITKPKGNNVCMAFCRHLAAKHYGGSALELYNALMRQPTTDMGYAWIRRAFQAVDIGAAEIQQWFAAE